MGIPFWPVYFRKVKKSSRNSSFTYIYKNLYSGKLFVIVDLYIVMVAAFMFPRRLLDMWTTGPTLFPVAKTLRHLMDHQ